jgi:hypothetical protein
MMVAMRPLFAALLAPLSLLVVAANGAANGAADLAAQEPDKNREREGFAIASGWTVAATRFDLDSTLKLLAAKTKALGEANEFTIERASWLAQAFMASGSTLRAGPYRDQLKTIAVWLRGIQYESGQFMVGGKPCSRAEQLLATGALTECSAISQYTLLVPVCRKAAETVCGDLEAAEAAPVTAKEFVLLALLAEQLPRINRGSQDLADRCRELANQARTRLRAGKERRADAALHLGAMLLETQFPPELIVAKTSPANPTADPLHTWYGALALRRTDPKTWQAETANLSKLIAVRTTDGDDAGSWPAAAGFDQVTTTAILATVIALANRDPFPASDK